MEEHIDALYRVVHTAPPAASTQALMLLFHLAVGSKVEKDQQPEPISDSKNATENARQDRFYRAMYATLSKASLVSIGKHLTMFFNLLYKAMKYDTDVNRINAFAKRLMCTVLHANPAPIAGSLFLLNEIAKTHDGLRQCMEEVPDESDAHVFLDDTKREPRAALISKDKDGNDEPEDRQRIRHPPSWELSLVAHHFHPSVAKFANSTGAIEYAGDPLKDFALAPFLDKFAYKNPKSRDKLASHYKRGESVAERRSGRDGVIESRLELPMNDPAFLERDDVGEQDEFFRTFFTERARRDEIKGITRGAKQEDEERREEAEEGAIDISEGAEGLDTGKSVSSYQKILGLSGMLCMEHEKTNLSFPSTV
jgi:ribosome biogenesis protein MAK21